ncbi:uncharacterized protein LOC116308246 [Actinia tenebrosa]|uniref:Uncharacterized protein LOC116308246 n=1 Tax=Actinia tenebrosa TaxID=6105 RepID=A0A6P8J4D3_ACTTE|nr:uncharacterized protein LOC116308246 [Actinia tenebrosa]
MAECLVKFLPEDVPGAILPCPLLEDNTFEDLKRYVETRAFTVGKQESKVKLLKRISDLKSSGLDKFIVDPDGDVQYAIIEEHVRQKIPDISPPLLKNWTKDMAVPTDFSYSHLYEYLVKRTITILKVNTKSKNTHLEGKSKDRDLYKNMQVTILYKILQWISNT